jgi:hypothetical protein
VHLHTVEEAKGFVGFDDGFAGGSDRGLQAKGHPQLLNGGITVPAQEAREGAVFAAVEQGRGDGDVF